MGKTLHQVYAALTALDVPKGHKKLATIYSNDKAIPTLKYISFDKRGNLYVVSQQPNYRVNKKHQQISYTTLKVFKYNSALKLTSYSSKNFGIKGMPEILSIDTIHLDKYRKSLEIYLTLNKGTPPKFQKILLSVIP